MDKKKAAEHFMYTITKTMNIKVRDRINPGTKRWLIPEELKLFEVFLLTSTYREHCNKFTLVLVTVSPHQCPRPCASISEINTFDEKV